MTTASGISARITYVEEVTRGVTPPTPTLKTARLTERKINLKKDTLESKEVRASRQKADVRHGFNQDVGTFGFQLGIGDFDDFLAYTLQGTWAAVTTVPTTITAVAATPAFTRASGSFVTDGFRQGDWVTSTGFSINPGNNGTFLVVAVAALTLTIVGTLINETGSGDEVVQVQGKRLDTGTTLKAITVEKQFTDLPKYQVFRGVAFDKMKLTATQKNMVGGTFSLLGMSALAGASSSISGSAPTAVGTHSPFADFDGAIYHNGSAITVATSLECDVNNNLKLEGVIGSKFSPDIFNGEQDITGNASIFLENLSYYDEFFNETEVSIWLRLNDPNGVDFMTFTWPRVKFLNNEIDPPQQGPIVQVMPWRALESTVYPGVGMTIQRSNVT